MRQAKCFIGIQPLLLSVSVVLGSPRCAPRVQDSVYNLDPEKPEMIDDFTAAMLEKEGKEFSELETEIVEAPFVQVEPGS